MLAMLHDDAVAPVSLQIAVADQVVGDPIGKVGDGTVGSGHHRFLIAEIVTKGHPLSPELFPVVAGNDQIPGMRPLPLVGVLPVEGLTDRPFPHDRQGYRQLRGRIKAVGSDVLVVEILLGRVMLDGGFHQPFSRLLPDFQNIKEGENHNVKGKGVNAQPEQGEELLKTDGDDDDQGKQP